MSYPKQIRNYNAFVDGISYFGRCTEGKLPDLKIMTAAYRGAGMDGPVGVDMGLEGMKSELTFAEFDPALAKLIGRVNRFVLRPVHKGESGAAADTMIYTIGGLITMHEPGAFKPGSDTTLKMTIDLRTYRYEHNGEVIWDIDLENGKRVIGGIDQLADHRRAMGL